MSGWIGVDLDTLAHYDEWVSEQHIGAPVPEMLFRVRRWLDEGKRVKVFTARVCPIMADGSLRNPAIAREAIHQWCREHLGKVLEVTHEKDSLMIELWDDRCVQVEANYVFTLTGRRIDGGDC